jgi:crotonobetainyl-CoA:carnitine CoA-transferase CaiB-like acyl-CoA transferase
MAAAYLVPIGILAALSAREETGRGQHVETSLFQGALALTTMLWVHAERGQNEIQASMTKTYPPGIHQRSIYECADGWIHAAGGRSKGKSVTEILGLPDEASPMAVMQLGMAGTPEARVQLEAIQRQIADAYRKSTVAELVDQFTSNGLGAEPIVPMDEMLFHPQLVATGAVVEVVDPEVGPTTQLGVTVYLEKTPGRVTTARPRLGQHTEEVLAEAAAMHAAPSKAAKPGRPLDHALADFRVLDFGRAFAGPFAAMILATLGADVIKVQAPGVPMMGGGPELGCGQGKRAISVDMKRPEGMRIAHELIARSDLVHHNMTLGVAERLGIDYETLRSINPNILYCNTYMYGPVGPLAALGGLDPMAQAAAGLEYEAGPVHAGNTPLWYRFGHGDTANAFSSIVGVLAALLHRKRTGEGQQVWATLLHGAALWGSGVYRGPDGAPELARLDKAQTGLGALYRLYEAQGGWIQIAALKAKHWPALCQAVGRADLVDDERFASPEARYSNRSALETELGKAFGALTPLQWRRRLDSVGVPSEIPVDTHDGESWLFDEELLRLGLVAEVDHAVHGRLRQVGQLITFSDTPGVNRLAPPVVGQDTVELMRWLGYDDETIASYRDQGIVDFPDKVVS